MSKSKEIFDCRDVNWAKVERVFAHMQKGQDAEEGVSEFTLPDLAVLKEHLSTCKSCTSIFVALANKYGFGGKESPEGKSQPPQKS